jgi:HD-GYP domain-containing protein (c-di-GMP phosphodiesterase class II)
MSAPLTIVVRGTPLTFDVMEGVRLRAGRAADCEIHIDDQSVSRHHLALERHGASIVVNDLESANGTFINERQVRTGTARAGDVIRAGTTVLEVHDQASRDRAAASLPTMVGDSSSIESVIRKRIEPSRFEWLLSGPPSGGPELALLQRAQRHLETLHRVSELLAFARDIDSLSGATLKAILEVTAADRAALVLRRPPPDNGSDVAAARSRFPGQPTFTVSRTLIADVIDKGISTFAHDATVDERFSSGESVIGQQVRSVMCVPLRTADQILGAIYVDSLSGAGKFAEADLELLAAIGNQAGVALHRVRLLGELKELLLDTIRAIAATIDAKDGYTHRHSERVAALSKRIALELGMTPEEQETVVLSALLHDVGKIAVPDSILNKPEKLTAEEYTEMKKHPLHGARILANIQSAAVKAVLPGVQYHHEKWDGTGYPEGLVAEKIPLLGRLLGVSDFFDALTSARAYRAAMPVDEVVAMIHNSGGTHFDPAITEVVVRLHKRGALLPDDWDA